MKKNYLYTGKEFRSVSWSSVFAGTVTVLSVLLVLNLIGLSIGLFSFDLDGKSGLGTGTIIWWIISNIIALCAGGYVAGRVGTSFSKEGGMIHGFLTWAVYAIISMWLVTSMVGSIFTGVGNVLGTVTQGASQMISGININNTHAKNLTDDDIQKARNEFEALLRDTEKEELQPENLNERVEDIKSATKAEAEIAAKNPNTSDEELNSIFDRLKVQGNDVLEEVDKEALVNVVKNRTDMTEAEARDVVNSYEKKYYELMANAKEGYQEFKANASESVDEYTDQIGSLTIWTAIALIIGAVVAAFGGSFGAKRNLTEEV